MISPKSLLPSALALACAALTFSLAVSARAQNFDVLASFNKVNAYPPIATFVQGTDGDLYSVSANASNGHVQDGNVFSMTSTGSITDLFYFCPVANYPNCTHGMFPSSIILGRDGNFYGTTSLGGTYDCGVVFKTTPAGAESTVYNFCTTADGLNPNGIVQGSNGNFYVATQTAISEITPSGTATVLHTFCTPKGCPDGYEAVAAPVEASNGTFYGITQNGGTQNAGVVYEITAAGHYNVLHKFCSQPNCADGSDPNSLVQDASGNLYGTTPFGGASLDSGTLFKITPANEFSVLHTFELSEAPQSLIIGSDGNLYGTTGVAGGYGGTVFQMTPQGVYTDVYHFCAGDACTIAGLITIFQATDGIFYGTTANGGNMGYGEAYSFSNNLSPLVATAPAAGKVGQSIIILGNGLTGSTSVTFNGVPAKFMVDSDTYMKATIPAGAATGKVSVVTPSGTLNSTSFVVTR